MFYTHYDFFYIYVHFFTIIFSHVVSISDTRITDIVLHFYLIVAFNYPFAVNHTSSSESVKYVKSFACKSHEYQ